MKRKQKTLISTLKIRISISECNILYNSWLLFMNIKNIYDINIDIYTVSHSLFYKEDEYETDSKYFYKYLMNIIVDKFVDK